MSSLYLPATHSAQGPPSGPDAPEMQKQSVKTVPPLNELEFAGHSLQFTEAVLLTVPEYLPSPQLMHSADPCVSLYFPATHALQIPPSGPDTPGVQVQFVKKELPADELEFVGQSLQTALPVCILYFPSEHAVHGPPSGPAEPALQLQLVTVELPVGEVDNAGQARHVDSSVAPSSLEKVPGPQLLQKVDPAAVLYFPGKQFGQKPLEPSGADSFPSPQTNRRASAPFTTPNKDIPGFVIAAWASKPTLFTRTALTLTAGDGWSVAALVKLKVTMHAVPDTVPPDTAVSTSSPVLLVHPPVVPSSPDVDETAKDPESSVCEPVRPEIVTKDPVARS